MRVLFINQFFYPDEAPTAQLLTNLAEDLVSRGFEVAVIAGTGRYLGGRGALPLREVHQGVAIYRVPTSGFGRGNPLGRIADYLGFYLGALLYVLLLPPFRATVLMSSPPLIAVLGPMVRFLKGSRFIYWVQDVYPDLLVALGRMKRRGGLTRALTTASRWSFVRADRLIVLGGRMRERVLEKGADPRAISVVHNWADGKELFPDSEAGRLCAQRHQLDGSFRFVYSGNFGNSHEFETFLAAAAELKTQSMIRFVFIGDGPQRPGLEKRCGQAGLSNVVFLPFQPRQTLRASLNMADVHLVSLMPNLDGLMLPSKIYGIMAVGKPVVFVGPEESEVAEIIRASGCGFVVQPGDSKSLVGRCLELFGDAALRNELGSAGRRYFREQFDRQLATAQFGEILGETR